MSIERSHQSTAVDTLRWGDVDTIVIRPTDPETVGVSKQIVQAHWRWPIAWQCLILGTPSFASDESGNFELDLKITVGVGATTMTFVRKQLYTLGGLYVPTVDLFVLPAQDIQSTFTLFGPHTATTAESFQVGMFVAPVTEPHAMTLMLDHAQKDAGERQGGWMPAGFTPEELGYRR